MINNWLLCFSGCWCNGQLDDGKRKWAVMATVQGRKGELSAVLSHVERNIALLFGLHFHVHWLTLIKNLTPHFGSRICKFRTSLTCSLAFFGAYYPVRVFDFRYDWLSSWRNLSWCSRIDALFGRVRTRKRSSSGAEGCYNNVHGIQWSLTRDAMVVRKVNR